MFLPIPGSLLDERGREEEDAARVNFRLHGDVISEPHPTPPGPVYTTERCIFVVETGRKREIFFERRCCPRRRPRRAR